MSLASLCNDESYLNSKYHKGPSEDWSKEPDSQSRKLAPLSNEIGYFPRHSAPVYPTAKKTSCSLILVQCQSSVCKESGLFRVLAYSYITYKSVKFLRLPNVTGIVPLKLFAESMLRKSRDEDRYDQYFATRMVLDAS